MLDLGPVGMMAKVRTADPTLWDRFATGHLGRHGGRPLRRPREGAGRYGSLLPGRAVGRVAEVDAEGGEPAADLVA